MHGRGPGRQHPAVGGRPLRAHLGVDLDPAANRAATTDAEISAAGAAARTVVVTAREDLGIRRQVRGLLAS
ncbi:hypothetical protein [Blastococcus sp. SYSU D00813]